MSRTSRLFVVVLVCACAAAGISSSRARAQTLGEPEEFTATAIVNNNLASGAGMVLIRVTRWSTDAERTSLIQTLQQKGADSLLDELKKMPSTGTIRTPDSLGYDLRYARETPTAEGGRQIVLATDRPIGFWETVHQPRTIQYPFSILQMQMDKDGKGKGTLSYATKIIEHNGTVELENYATQPAMLTEITSKKIHH